MGNFKTIGTWVGAVTAAPFTGGASLVVAVVGGAVAGRVTGALIDHTPVGSLTKSLIDNVFRDTVVPVEGSILHCSLFGAEHTGIYIGDGLIVELLGTGVIRTATAEGFIDRTNAVSLYVACDGDQPIGSKAVAERAKAAIGETRDYYVLFDNCHQFSSGCITGNYSDATTAFWMLEKLISDRLNGERPITWRVWNTAATNTVQAPNEQDELKPPLIPAARAPSRRRKASVAIKSSSRPGEQKSEITQAPWPFPSATRPE